MARLLIHLLIFHGMLFAVTCAWRVIMPRSIKALHGSCVVIPCSFSYYSNLPTNPNRVVWYTYSSSWKTYPVACDDKNPSEVIWKFQGKTSLYGDLSRRDCSLLIKDINTAHHGEELYPWVDPENVGRGTLHFWDVRCKIDVENSAEKPTLQIFGGHKIGDTITFQCSTYHTCPYSPPFLSVSGVQGCDSVEHTHISDGKWKTTLTCTGIVNTVNQRVECNVSHPGDLKSSVSKVHTADCSVDKVQINPDSNTEFIEGVEKEIVCSVTYMCPKDRPYITWNDGELSGSISYLTGTKQEARSILRFTAKGSDQGRVITCTTEFKGVTQRAYITLKVKRSMFSRDWTFSIPKTITGVLGSCVVIPCSFSFKTSSPSNIKPKWYKFSTTQYPLVYDQSTWNIIPEFKGKTSLYGSPNEGNCSLKIQPLEMQHNQERLFPWVDPTAIDKFHRENYFDVTVALDVTDFAERPQVDVIGIQKVGEQITISCSVIHTCPPNPPTLSLSVSRGTQKEMHMPVTEGKWKKTKEISWKVQEEDKLVTCEVTYNSGQTSKNEVKLNPLCAFHDPKISPKGDEVMEGIEKIFTCTVSHTCQKQKPSLTWNYYNMPVSVETLKSDSNTWKTVSTLKFKAVSDDHGKKLTCTATSMEQETSDSTVLKVKRGMSSLDWTYSMPSTIKGLRGSCLLIPCSFDFKTTQPSNVMVRWYRYSNKQFRIVYDEDGQKVEGMFWGKTKLSGLPSEGNCSLEITTLESLHNGVRLYPWMDPKPVEEFHRENSFDNSIELHVTEQADPPKLSIIGIPKVGEQITLSCSVRHTCPLVSPRLVLNNAPKDDSYTNREVENVFWEVIKYHTFSILEDEQTITCTATFQGGQTSKAQVNLNAQCTYKDVHIEPEVADVTEGVAKNFTCTVFNSCKRQLPSLTWNYEDMPVSNGSRTRPTLATFSTISYLASMEDNGKKLTCTAKFPDGEMIASVVLQVNKYVPKEVDPFENDTIHIFPADVHPRIIALTQSCVVIPCSFQTGSEPITRLRGLWRTTTGGYVYHTGQSRVLDNFKGRTQLLGNPDEQNCTLEIDDVQAHDNGPFCFSAEKGDDKYRFNKSCVFIVMKASPNKPVISALPEEMEPGQRFSITCSVTHTCISHPPSITWNVPTGREVISHEETGGGLWKTISSITFIPTGYEKETDLICKASFWGGKKQETATFLSVKRYEGLGMVTIIAPLLSCVVFCIIVGIIIYKIKASRKTSTKDGSPDERRSMWSRLSSTNRHSMWSRISRADGRARWQVSSNETTIPQRPPRPEKRRSIWSRFSRKATTANQGLMVQYKLNNDMAGATGHSKPRLPSPKSAPKSYSKSGGGSSALYEVDYIGNAQDTLYGNM